MGKFSELYNKLEDERNAELIKAAIVERNIEIENIEYDIYLFGLALNALDIENIRDIKKVDGEFVITFKDDQYLHHISELETPEGVKFHDKGRGFKIYVADSNPEMIDEYFRIIIKSIEAFIDDRRLQIATIKWRRNS